MSSICKLPKKRKATSDLAASQPRRSDRLRKQVQSQQPIYDSDVEDDDIEVIKSKPAKKQKKQPAHASDSDSSSDFEPSDSDSEVELENEQESEKKQEVSKPLPKIKAKKQEKTEKKKEFWNKKKAIKNSVLPTYDVSKIRVGDVISQTWYARVDDIIMPPHASRPTLRTTHVRAAGTFGNPQARWDYHSEAPIQICSASEYSRTEEVTRTEMLQRLAQCGGDVFTVKFYPRDDKPEDKLKYAKALFQELEDSDEKDRESDRFWKDALENVDEKLKTPRVLIGRLVRAAADVLAYTLVDDLEDPTDDRKISYKSVNNRTVFELITRGVRYVLKNPRS